MRRFLGIVILFYVKNQEKEKNNRKQRSKPVYFVT